jgi:hypothetical protein
MEISKPQIRIKNKNVVVETLVRSLQGTKTLWYSFDKEFGDLITDFSDAALVGLLIPAMARSEDIYLMGKISEKLFYNLSYRAQNLIKQVIPSLSIVKIYPEDAQHHVQNGEGVATGFSGGIDSFNTLVDYYYSDVPEGLRITHLLYHNVGSHGLGRRKLFKKRFEHLKPLAEKIGFPFIAVDSNLESFYGGKDSLKFQLTYPIRNASNPLVLQNGLRKFLISSDVSYSDVYVGPHGYLSYIDPVLMPLIGTEVLDLIPVGCEFTRIQKTLRISNVYDTYNYLDVCVDDKPGVPWNCSKCFKCLRTMLTMEIAGVLNMYTNSFNISTYLKHRDDYIKKLYQANDIYSRQILKFAEDRNYHLR